jgi:beta-mannosidase
MIPLEEFEGLANAEAFTYLLQSVVDGGLNTLRVWGGGISFTNFSTSLLILLVVICPDSTYIFLYDVFYDTCDELGIIIYHDMMYAQEGHSPADTPTQDAELRHQVRRLSHHPSIIVSSRWRELHNIP